MKTHWVWRRLVTLTIALVWVFGCGKGKKDETTASKESLDMASSNADEGPSYDYESYAPLSRLMTEVTLPMLVDDSGIVEQTCFKLEKDLNTKSASMDIKAQMKKHPEALQEVIANWLLEEIGIYGVSEYDIAEWDIDVSYPVMLEMDPTSLRFEEGEECIGESGWLDEGVRVATTIIGTRQLSFETKKRLSIDAQDNLKQGLEERGLTLDASGLELYQPVIGDDGNPKYNDKEQLLFTGPGGVNITEMDLPPESERGIKEWVIKSEEPLYFAFQQLPSDAWQKESKRKACNVFLVWGDPTPRSPECEEFTNVSFVVEKKDEDSIKVEVTMDDESVNLVLPFEKTEKIMLAERAYFWLNAKKEEEGVTIRLNSLVVGEIFAKKR